MTARIHLLSPDIRRPGRVGDLIIPVLDPTGEDRTAFVRWMLDGVMEGDIGNAAAELEPELQADSLRRLRGPPQQSQGPQVSEGRTADDGRRAGDHVGLHPAGDRRHARYQTLQALVNCTRRSLLPDPDISAEQRELWQSEIRELERHGVR